MAIENLRLLVLNPSRFMQHRVCDSPVWQPSTIILVTGLVSAIPGYLVLQYTRPGGGLSSSVFAIAQVVGIAVGVVSIAGIWVVVSAIIHGLSAYAGASDGTFRDTFKFVGWGFLPLSIANAFGALATWMILRSVPVSVSSAEIQSLLASSTLSTASLAVNIALTIWMCFIWYFGLVHVRNVDAKYAFSIAALPFFVRLISALVRFI